MKKRHALAVLFCVVNETDRPPQEITQDVEGWIQTGLLHRVRLSCLRKARACSPGVVLLRDCWPQEGILARRSEGLSGLKSGWRTRRVSRASSPAGGNVVPRGAVGLRSLGRLCLDREVGQPLVRDPNSIEATGPRTLRVRGTGRWLPALVVNCLCPRQEQKR